MDQAKDNSKRLSYKVSILVPIYNVEHFIEKCAVSLLEQDYCNIQYVFVNDCTPDNSMEVLQRVIGRYPHRNIVVINHEKNKGLSAARNTAVKAAEGEFVMHVDSDDYLSDNTAVSQLMQCQQQEQADVVIDDMQHVFADKCVVETACVPKDKVAYVNKILSRQTPVCVCGGVYRKSLYTERNIWAIEGLNYGEDYVTKPRLIYYANKVAHLKKPFYCYVHTNELSYTRNFSSNVVRDQKWALQLLEDFFTARPDVLLYAKAMKQAYARCKAECLIAWGLGNGTKEDFDSICSIKANMWQPLPVKLRLVLILAAWHMRHILAMYSKMGLAIKSLLK